jgi:hypothetical protein
MEAPEIDNVVIVPVSDINQSIQALFDSVYTINKAQNGEVTAGVDPNKVISINKEHIRLMLSKSEISNALTQEQKDELNLYLL